MALYAFDGTWNVDREQDERDTNVRKIFELSGEPEGKKLYTPGVGTRFRLLGQFLGGVFGAGSFSRVKEAYEHLKEVWQPGEAVDVVGFSRGSSLALDFVNTIVDRRNERGVPQPVIRFVGLFDVVGSFGIPFDVGPLRFQTWNLGHKLTLPREHVKHCFHALALDERRQTFVATHVAGAHEVWFRGVHSDIGGGNGNTKLSFITLRWMARKAMAAGVPIDQAKLLSLKLDAGIDPSAVLRLPKDFIPNDFRTCGPTDRRHYTVGPASNRADRDVCNPVALAAVETELDEVAAQAMV